MSPYTPQTWNDHDVTKPVSAARMTVIENGIAAAAMATDVAVIREAPLNIKDARFGAVSDGTTDDTTAVAAARAQLNPTYGGEILIPGPTKITGQIALGQNEKLIGIGAGTDQLDAASMLITSYNGEAVKVPDNTYGWGIEGVMIKGDRTVASQDLLVLGLAGAGSVRNVSIQDAGRDGLKLANTINAHFDVVNVNKSKRYGLNATGVCNANKFTKCLFRESDQWGVIWAGGTDSHFDTCTIESNSAAAGTDYGGMWVDATSQNIALHLTAVHFENNDGALGAGIPLLVDGTTTPLIVVERGTTYAEARGPQITRGHFVSLGGRFPAAPCAVVASTADRAVFIGPRSVSGASTFSITDSGAKSVILGADGKITVGDTTWERSGADTWFTTDQISMEGSAASDIRQQMRVTSDTFARHYDRVDGYRFYGSGSAGLAEAFGRRTTGALEAIGADLEVATAGKGVRIKEGTNAKLGTATLVAGTVTVNTTAVTASSRIFLSGQNSSGTHGELTVSARTAGTSFTITSSSGTDTRSVAWMIVEPL